MKTLDIVTIEPEDLKVEELNLWYFTMLNPLPPRTVLNKQLDLDEHLVIVTRSNWRGCDYNFYFYYENWFKELWKSQTVGRLKYTTMLNILRIMFSINSKKYKLEYSNIFNNQFYMDNVYAYIRRNTNNHQEP